jgi:hypothetical protein
MAWLLSLASLVSFYAPTARADSLAGDWYAEGTEGGLYLQVLDHRRDDGTFILVVRIIEACKPTGVSQETGLWHYKDGSLTRWTRSVGVRRVPDVPYYHASFAVTLVDHDHIQLVDDKTHVVWATARVAPDFKFPRPASCLNS